MHVQSIAAKSDNFPFAIAHLKLVEENDTAIDDGVHELYTYKVNYRNVHHMTLYVQAIFVSGRSCAKVETCMIWLSFVWFDT